MTRSQCPNSYRVATLAGAFGRERLVVVGITVTCPECESAVGLVRNSDGSGWIFKHHNRST